jgi:hypothetical protein
MHWIDPSVLPAIKGTIACFTRNTRGDVDGVLLSEDGQIHVPPHMGADVEKLFAVGDAIEARYVKPRMGDVFAAVSVTNASGRTLVDDGPPHHHDKHGPKHQDHPNKPAMKAVDLAGRVQRTLFAPKGEVAGAILESGEQLRVDPKANAELAPYFESGADIRVWGEALTLSGTTVVEVGEIGFSRDFD